MRNVGMLGLTLLVGFALVGCGGGMSEEKVKSVYGKYYDLNFEAVKGKKDFDSDKAWEEAAKSGGFDSKKAFDEAGAKWDAAKFSKAAVDASKEYTDKLAKWTKDQAAKPPEEAKPEKK